MMMWLVVDPSTGGFHVKTQGDYKWKPGLRRSAIELLKKFAHHPEEPKKQEVISVVRTKSDSENELFVAFGIPIEDPNRWVPIYYLELDVAIKLEQADPDDRSVQRLPERLRLARECWSSEPVRKTVEWAAQ